MIHHMKEKIMLEGYTIDLMSNLLQHRTGQKGDSSAV